MKLFKEMRKERYSNSYFIYFKITRTEAKINCTNEAYIKIIKFINLDKDHACEKVNLVMNKSFGWSMSSYANTFLHWKNDPIFTGMSKENLEAGFFHHLFKFLDDNNYKVDVSPYMAANAINWVNNNYLWIWIQNLT